MCILFLFNVRSYCVTINSSPPGAAYIRQWTGTALVQI